MSSRDEIVQLVIDARNLSSDELDRAAADVEGLGNAARRAEQQLDNLRINQGVLQSYNELRTSISQLRNDVAESEVSYQNQARAIRNNADATDEQRVAAQLARRTVQEQTASLRSQQREYNRLQRQLREAGVNTRSAAISQEQLTTEIRQAEVEASRLTREYSRQGEALREKVASERASSAATEQLEQDTREAADAVERLAREEREAIAAEQRLEDENRQLAASLRSYEQALERLNQEKAEGNLTTGNYIRAEARLRQQLGLTAAQARVSRSAIEADNRSRANSVGSTDLLTTATRRLAQAYTVLIAAQSAAQAVGSSVTAYGELEAAITNVERTTDLARTQVVAIQEELTRLATDVTPTATNELLRYGQVAGQLGAEGAENILRVAAAADALDVATNLAGDEAATLLTRILQMTNEGIPSINSLASVVVDLGNNFAVNEQQITQMTREIVTGTTAINLGSTAAAAFGTTLGVLGQQGERSRTAFFRLADAINTATTEGGENLERLSNITGLTADEIEQNLGERPEVVLQAFIQGLNRINSEGGLASNALRELGIDGSEAISVFNVLANNTDLLARALERADEAAVSADAHFVEASRTYANQESVVARLRNRFTELQTAIGETFSDETDTALRSFDTLITTNQESVAGLFEGMSELAEGVIEVVQAFESLNPVNDGLSIIGDSIQVLRIAANDFTLGVRTISLAFNELLITAGEAFFATEETLNNLRQSGAEIAAAITQDLEDIESATRRLNRESSASYEDLQRAATQYASAITRLSEAQQAELEVALRADGFREGSDANYRSLTAALVRYNREIEIETQLTSQKNTAQTENVGTITELAVATENVATVTRRATENTIQSIEATESNSRATLELAARVREQEAALRELELQARSLTATDTELLDVETQLAELRGELSESSAELAMRLEFESLTVFQLTERQRAHLLVVEQLQQQFQAGSITLGEYTARSEQLEVTTNLLNSALGSNSQTVSEVTEVLRRDTVEVIRNRQERQQLTEVIDENTDSLVRNRNEMVASSSGGSTGADPAAAALINEIGLTAYNELLRQTTREARREPNRIADSSALSFVGPARARLQRLEDEALERANEARQQSTGTGPGPGGQVATGSRTIRIEITINGGTTAVLNGVDQNSADSLISALSALGEVNISGVG